MALDYILPTFATFQIPDLVISGPNIGWTMRPFVYTVSGTLGAIIAAIERGVPAIAFSSANIDSTPYDWVNASTKIGLQDPATINARLASTLIHSLIDKAAGSPILPKGYGIVVNMPYITSHTSDECTNPPFITTRETEGLMDKVRYDAKSGLVVPATVEGDDTGADKLLWPVERDDANPKCASAVTVFTVHYDPSHNGQCIMVTNTEQVVPVVVMNGTTPGTNGPVVVIVGNSTGPDPTSPGQPPAPAITGLAAKSTWSMTALVIGLCIAAFSL